MKSELAFRVGVIESIILVTHILIRRTIAGILWMRRLAMKEEPF